MSNFDFKKYLAEGRLLKEDIGELRGKELLDFFHFTKYVDVDIEELENEFIEYVESDWFDGSEDLEEEKKDFVYETWSRYLDLNEDKISEYLGFEVDTFRMGDDFTLGEPMGVEFVLSDSDFEDWMDQVGPFWK